MTTDLAGLREQIAKVLARTELNPPFPHCLAMADAVLAVLPASVDRATVLNEAADALGRMDYEADSQDYGYDTFRDAWNGGVIDGAAELRRMAVEAQQQTGSGSLELPGPKFKENAESLNGAVVLNEAARTIAADAALRETEGEYALAEYGYELARLIRPKELPAVVPGGAGEAPAHETQALAAMFEGLHTLLATSSRDWQTYRVDAWLWAILCGWDCEQAEHDETCTHGALEETAAIHGWDDATVAKARRYRAAVRILTGPAGGAQAKEVRRCAHTDIVYGRCMLPMPGHDGRECFHEKQPARVDEETDEDSLCGNEYPGDGNFVGQLCALPKDHFGEHRCDESFAGVAYTALLRWPNQDRP
ncbi:hypothetical protein [Streptomyces sp. STR69]|uniref:hypothetical protein n=1 Tax=Streptomyces sp. STR69 TaxID=1796942 RepID=UPI0021C7CA00|nr:hypothetical protein [Streptomyces sp. STR69]